MEHNEVTVVCFTYNQKDYIKDTLKGIVMQKTNFPFIAIIHDDKSTDGTDSIIREYEKKYPNIIKGVYEQENQYSKGGAALVNAVLPYINSNYVALCEGDDFWTDSSKLQRQYDILERNPHVDICAHEVSIFDTSNNREIKSKKVIKRSHYDVGTVISKGGSFVATCSLFMRKKIYIDVPVLTNGFTIDYAYQIYGAINGGMLYINDSMATYRRNSIGSWSVRSNKNASDTIRFHNDVIEMLKKIDVYTNKEYNKYINKAINHCKYIIICYSNNFKEVFSDENFTKISFVDKLRIVAKFFLSLINRKER